MSTVCVYVCDVVCMCVYTYISYFTAPWHKAIAVTLTSLRYVLSSLRLPDPSFLRIEKDKESNEF